MTTRSVGPKGQVVIPKHMREALALKTGVEVTFELREKEIIIKKPKITGDYAEYFITTTSAKLKKPVNIKELIENETNERNSLC
ncbi:MAG: AbrB/MazE/SpoVT family DNA-binding domain-containing protein [Candidatus Bathyarchaeota archaeon]|nr:AbrB/MazE/SpoVT family DNA-binding domain-containing protein [Candidatus Termiticorpusculum sp.]